MAVGDTYRLTCVWHREGREDVAVNNFYFRQDSLTILDTPEEDLVEAFKLNVQAAYIGCVTNFLVLFKYAVAKAPDFLTSHEDFITPVAGGRSGDPLPPRTSGLLSLRTGDLTRRGRGRVYLPPASEADSTNGFVATAYFNLMVELAHDLTVDMPAESIVVASWQPMMWSKADAEAKEVTSILIRDRWKSQRDRDGIY